MSQTNHPAINSNQISQLQKERISHWYQAGTSIQSTRDLWQAIERNHLNNFSLWLDEDKARRDDKGFEYVYRAKRQIDQYNQQRNNEMEIIDTMLFNTLQPIQTDVEFHSETPGMMIDRLSILHLKQYHMHQQTLRTDVNETHRQTCQTKLKTIDLQIEHLMHCLDRLVEQVQAGTRSFRVYHQFKMYNDSTLNPELYKNETDTPV